MIETICDRATFRLLKYLDANPKGLRFKELKQSFGKKATEPIIARRLELLRNLELIESKGIVTNSDHFFVNVLTVKGKQFCDQVGIDHLMKAIDHQDTLINQSRKQS